MSKPSSSLFSFIQWKHWQKLHLNGWQCEFKQTKDEDFAKKKTKRKEINVCLFHTAPYRTKIVNGTEQTLRNRAKEKRLRIGIPNEWQRRKDYSWFFGNGKQLIMCFGIKIFECFMPKMSLRQMWEKIVRTKRGCSWFLALLVSGLPVCMHRLHCYLLYCLNYRTEHN